MGRGMKRPSTARRSASKAPGHKASKAKRINSTKTKRGTQESASSLRKQLERRTAELARSRAQQIATSDILRVISQSPTDVRPVFDAIVEAAVGLLGCDLAFILRCDDTAYTQAAVASLHGKLAL